MQVIFLVFTIPLGGQSTVSETINGGRNVAPSVILCEHSDTILKIYDKFNILVIKNKIFSKVYMIGKSKILCLWLLLG